MVVCGLVKLESGSKVQYFPEEVCVTVIDRYDGAEPPLTTSDAQYWNDNETEEGFGKGGTVQYLSITPISTHHRMSVLLVPTPYAYPSTSSSIFGKPMIPQ